MQLLLAIRQLQLSFEDRDVLEESDRAVIKQLGRKYRGRAAWPSFRSFKPGYLPWRIDAAEADVLMRTLEQAIDVLTRVDDDETLLEPKDDENYLMRVPETQAGEVIWRDAVVKIPPPPLPELNIQFNSAQVEAARKLRKQKTLELDIAVLPDPVTDEDGRPYFASLILVVDGKSGMVLVSEFLPLGEPPIHTIAGALQLLLNTFIRWGWVPDTINLRHDMAKELLTPLMKILGVKLKVKRELPKLDQALEFLLARFGGDWSDGLDEDNDPPPVRHRGPR